MRQKNRKELGSRRKSQGIQRGIRLAALAQQKIGTSFNVDYDLVDDYDWVEHSYIDGTVLAQRFFAPVQEGLYEYSNAAVAYAKSQTEM